MGVIFQLFVDGFRAGSVGHLDRRVYALAAGERLSVGYGPAWCLACRAFVQGEQFESLATYDAWIADAEFLASCSGFPASHDGDPAEQWERSFRAQHLPDLRRRRAWRATRRAPPHCLVCGATKIVLFVQNDATDVPSVGRVTVNALLGDIVAEIDRSARFTPEGIRIGPARA